MGGAFTLLLALQAAANSQGPMARIDFDLAHVQPSEPAPWQCGDGSEEEIVVCGRVRGAMDKFTPEEMEELARRYADKQVRAAVHLGDGADAGLMFSPVEFPGGGMSNRMMVTFHLKF